MEYLARFKVEKDSVLNDSGRIVEGYEVTADFELDGYHVAVRFPVETLKELKQNALRVTSEAAVERFGKENYRCFVKSANETSFAIAVEVPDSTLKSDSPKSK